ncbi:MAG: glutaredoxin family protein [Burkholderiales bacterium]|nr:glutaredoxin family protein [Burkholderiales bacterium]
MASRTFSLIAAACMAAGTLVLSAPTAQAQYKWVGADGRVNYSDLPPPPDDRRTLLRAPGSPAAARSEPQGGEPQRNGAEARLPYALRTALEKHPVVLYTTGGCEPCDLARTHLTKRGVPYTEKRVRTQADTKAFETLGFESAQFPSISVGRDKMVGFEPSAWGRMLDAAGYPKSSVLPANYAARPAEDMRAESEPAAQQSARRAAARGEGPQAGEGAADASGSAGRLAGAGAGNAGDASSLLRPATYDVPDNPIRF